MTIVIHPRFFVFFSRNGAASHTAPLHVVHYVYLIIITLYFDLINSTAHNVFTEAEQMKLFTK